MSIRIRKYHLDRQVQHDGYAFPAADVAGMYEQLEPAREGSIHSDVLVPLYQALITGLFAGAIAAMLTWAFITENGEYAFYAGSTVSVLVSAAVWFSLLQDHKRMLWRVERMVGKDFDGDGIVGEPDRLVVEIQERGSYGERTEFVHLDVDRNRFLDFVRGVLGGEPISVARWTGERGIFRRGEFETIRGELLKRGILRWRGARNHGVELTEKGREVFRGLLNGKSNP